MTDWNSEKDMTIKKMVTSDLVKMFPDCRKEVICLMTSLSFTDLRELVKQGKIDASTVIYNFDNLSSMKTSSIFTTKEEEFKREWRKKSREIFREASLNPPKDRLICENIFTITLDSQLEKNGHKPFKLVYADSCNTLTDSILIWMNSGGMRSALADDGLLALTVSLNHKSLLQENTASEDVDLNNDVFQFYAGKYDGVKNMMHYASKMSVIKSLIEKEHNWTVEKMIHYCEQDRKSQMVVAVCKKA